MILLFDSQKSVFIAFFPFPKHSQNAKSMDVAAVLSSVSILFSLPKNASKNAKTQSNVNGIPT
jgi:hypothetical protein